MQPDILCYIYIYRDKIFLLPVLNHFQNTEKVANFAPHMSVNKSFQLALGPAGGFATAIIMLSCLRSALITLLFNLILGPVMHVIHLLTSILNHTTNGTSKKTAKNTNIIKLQLTAGIIKSNNAYLKLSNRPTIREKFTSI